MFPTASFTAFLLLAVSVTANPIVDQARAKNFMDYRVGVTNVAVVYQATVGVGSPATNYNLLIDMGSSNTWVGAGKTYVRTSTSVQTSNSVSVTYGSGSFSGTEFIDTVTIGSGLVVSGQYDRCCLNLDWLYRLRRIGPTDLTIGTSVANETRAVVSPQLQTTCSAKAPSLLTLVSVSFEPTITTSVKNGELMFGGADYTKFTASSHFHVSMWGASLSSRFQIPLTRLLDLVPLLQLPLRTLFWGINESIRYGTSTSILTTTAGIVNTGTTLILIATEDTVVLQIE
ncbi:aspartic peptidase domain-containing protein [Multifurca ochricompacta]|uniref:Aspartic peptidase domain-containing protein n=1 Tax=Multifurca ochricompacta TaxID=376703 RepID=A0AAD4LXQ6_9AGAM|nr:aspartic peptidase domain-containing protein [Multifurca ochricompacta]